MKVADFQFADQIPGEIVKVERELVAGTIDQYTVTYIDSESEETVVGVWEATEEWSAEGWGHNEKTEEFVLFQRVA